MADAIIKAVPRVILQFLVMSLVLFVFSAVGVNLGGRFGYCADAAGARLAVEVVTDKVVRAESGYRCCRGQLRHDAPALARCGVLFIDGWVPIMYMSLDVRGIDEQPATETTRPVLYLVFIMVGTLFFMNLIIGGIVGTFEELFRESKGIHVLTEEQERRVSAQQVMQRFGSTRRTSRSPPAAAAAARSSPRSASSSSASRRRRRRAPTPRTAR